MTENNKGGRPVKYDKEQIITLSKEGMTARQIAENIGCSIATVRKVIQKHNKSLETNDVIITPDIITPDIITPASVKPQWNTSKETTQDKQAIRSIMVEQRVDSITARKLYAKSKGFTY